MRSHMLQVSGMMVEGTAVFCWDTESLHVEIFQDSEVIPYRGRRPTETSLEERERELNWIKVGGVGG